MIDINIYFLEVPLLIWMIPICSLVNIHISHIYFHSPDDMIVESNKNRKQDLKPKKNALDEIMEMEERRKEKCNRRNNWLHEGIVVKVNIYFFFFL